MALLELKLIRPQEVFFPPFTLEKTTEKIINDKIDVLLI